MIPSTTFDKNNAVYMCCCGSCHVTTGALIVGILQIIRDVAAFIYGCVIVASPIYNGTTILISSIIYTALSVTACVLLFVGIRRERASFAIMLMVMQILHIIGLCITLIIFIVTFTGASFIIHFHGLTNAAFGVIIAVLIVFIGLDVWFFTIVQRARRYLHALECHHHTSMPHVQYAAYPPGVVVAGQPVMTVGGQMQYAQPQYAAYPQQQQPPYAPPGSAANPAPGPYQPYGFTSDKPVEPQGQDKF